MSSPNAHRKLRGLRWSLTAAVATIAFIGVSLLSLITTLVDTELRSGENDAVRQGHASRLAAMVYPDDDTGVWNTEGVEDDSANDKADAIIVLSADGSVLYHRGDLADYENLLKQTVADEDEAGVQGTVLLDGEVIPAAGAPYWDFDTIEGAVIVALAAQSSPAHRQLRLLTWISAGLLTLLATFAAWLIAGRFVRPVVEALQREERFLATAAHDIRTPLSRIRALAESAQQSSRTAPAGKPSPQLSDDLQRLVASAVHASDTANDLLLAGRIDADQLHMRREPVRLDLLVAEFEQTMPTLAVEVYAPVSVLGDTLLLRHAIGNLISNAEQHGRVDGKATLIEASVSMDGEQATVHIADAGPGLRGVDAASIFERHANRNSGSGLGLWIARTVFEEHGGTVVALERSTTTGAEFVVRLPARSPDKSPTIARKNSLAQA